MLLNDLIGTLQLAIGPVILISGIGLIILSLTNRSFTYSFFESFKNFHI